MKTRKQQQALTISDSTQPQPTTKTRTTRQPVVMIYQQKQKQPTTTKDHNQKCKVIIPKLKIPPTNQINQTWDPTQLESEIQDKRQSTKRWVDLTRTYTYPNEINTAPEEEEELPEEQLLEPEELAGSEELAEPEELLQPKDVEELHKTEQKINHESRRSLSEEEEEEEEEDEEEGRPTEEPTQPNIPRSESTLEYLQLPPASSASTSQKTACRSPARDLAHEADCCNTPTNKKRIHEHEHQTSPENLSYRSEPSSDPKKARTTSYPEPSSSKPGPSRLPHKPSSASRLLTNVRSTRPTTPSGYDEEGDPFGFIHHAQQVARPTNDTHQPHHHSPPLDHHHQLPSGDNHNLSDLSLADLLNLPKKSTKQKKNAVPKKPELRKTSSSSHPVHRTRRLPVHKSGKVDILNNHNKIIKPSLSSLDKKRKGKKKKEINNENDEVDEQEEELQDLPSPSSSSSSAASSSSFLPGRTGQRRERVLEQTTDRDLLSSTDHHSPPPESSSSTTSSASASTRKILASKENMIRQTRASRRPTARTLKPSKKTKSLKQKTNEPKKKSTRKSRQEKGKASRSSKIVSAVSVDPLASEAEKDRQAARLRYYEALDQVQFEEEIVI
ncbi:uncharacterized protein PGTG_03109 [Puccinia graminis f. sp. tritici CRL 75-36-700-3]|uniref:Uncharacterized protein n=1 Tax=Puccinia graminis f. sp. tritici (strain CRL 75-36-700-3 / race SCCL) TaxID=418459 RepID=E3JYM8_PUCGT|nr:uncharacterized protein PGTG_03109 [Puccinia graminis f. sp. tritici CRL 75-36-700-3]EFP77153.1 hypothetical protein PGTG_03109 [Puccinia graminis f. sp. tritici CRL 75-36-700-3]